MNTPRPEIGQWGQDCTPKLLEHLCRHLMLATCTGCNREVAKILQTDPQIALINRYVNELDANWEAVYSDAINAANRAYTMSGDPIVPQVMLLAKCAMAGVVPYLNLLLVESDDDEPDE